MRIGLLAGLVTTLIVGVLVAEGRNDHVRWSGGDDQRLCVGGSGSCGPRLIIERTSYGTGGTEPVAP